MDWSTVLDTMPFWTPSQALVSIALLLIIAITPQHILDDAATAIMTCLSLLLIPLSIIFLCMQGG